MSDEPCDPLERANDLLDTADARYRAGFRDADLLLPALIAIGYSLLAMTDRLDGMWAALSIDAAVSLHAEEKP